MPCQVPKDLTCAVKRMPDLVCDLFELFGNLIEVARNESEIIVDLFVGESLDKVLERLFLGRRYSR